jgi:hypothetical protein
VLARCVPLAVATALAGCGVLQPAPATFASTNATHTVLFDASVMAQADRGSSRIDRQATSQDLLYISDAGTFDVLVYAFPSLTLAGKITGFNQPQGLCSDAQGDVWIANTGTQALIEYAHGGTSSIKKLADPLGYPAGCAIDPTSGDLAVTNLAGFSGAGGVLIYKKAGGTPTPYSQPQLYAYYFTGYDSGGNLYVSGTNAKKTYRLAVLPHGSKSMSLVALHGGTIDFPGTVAWSGSTLVLGDQRCRHTTSSCLYEATVAGKTATITAATPLGKSCDVAQVLVGATNVAGGNYCTHARSSVDIWPFPAGGNPTSKATGVQMPVGATLSSSS